MPIELILVVAPGEILKGMVTWIITPDYELPRNRLDSRH